MRGRRTVAIALAASTVWTLGRLLGSPTVHVVAVALGLLPIVAGILARRATPRVVARRMLSTDRAVPGERVTVDLELEGSGRRGIAFLLLEDRLPSALGGSARIVATGVPARGRGARRVSYTLEAPRRGRYAIGPLRLESADPFGFAPVQVDVDLRDELVVTPPVEELRDLTGSPFGQAGGAALARRLARGGGEFSLMRPYREGDDLRRIHWPSVARRGELMIRQDEASSRPRAVLHLDTRGRALGASGGAVFEQAVGAAASVGVALLRSGLALRRSTGLLAPEPTTEDALLDALAGVGEDGTDLFATLARLRASATADALLVVVTGSLAPEELAALTRTGSAFGPKLAILVPSRAGGDDAADAALHTLARAGWQVRAVPPGTSLRERWTIDAPTPRVGSSS